MVGELIGAVPKLPPALSPKLINRAWRTIRLSNLWSFNMFEASIITPPEVTAGTATVTQGLTAITFDATAIAALQAAQLANPYSLITQRQFRVSQGGIYNIISIDFATGKAVLDRIFGDPSSAGIGYQCYQVYYSTPMQDFLTYISVTNPQLNYDLTKRYTREYIDRIDPQRLYYAFPEAIVALGVDQRGRGTQTPSATLGWPLHELWGQPVQVYTYQTYGVRQGVDLVNDDDTIDYSVAEETVLARARMYAYEWAEANKEQTPRNEGPDFKFLYSAAEREYKTNVVRDRKNDREYLNNWFSVRKLSEGDGYRGFYSGQSGWASTEVG